MKELRWFVLATYVLFFLLLASRLSQTFLLLIFAGILWKTLTLFRGLSAPPRLVLVTLGFFCILFLLTSAPTPWHHATWSTIALVLCLFWMCDRPHAMQVMMVHLNFFALLIATLLMPGQPYPLTLYFSLTCLIFISLAYQHMGQVSRLSLVPLLRRLAKTAIPAALILLPIYFFFPELRHTPQDTAISGLNFSLEPGRYASLAESQRLAFRAYFPKGWGTADPTSFYWRLGVLEESYGMTWKWKTSDETWISWKAPSSEEGLAYELLREDRLGKNLPHLEAFRGTWGEGAAIRWNPDLNLLQAQEPLTRMVAGADAGQLFKSRSIPLLDADKIQPSERLLLWISRLKGLTTPEKIEVLRRELAQFRYTLTPGRLSSENPLDQFWFETRAGYCEHFAAAFASILRLSGTPARIVIGFQGGTIIDDQKFLLLRDRDAHAWTEVWHDQRWMRIDPTEMVPGSFREPQSSGWTSYLAAYTSYYSRLLFELLAAWWPDSELVNLILLGVLGFILLILSRRVLLSGVRPKPWNSPLNALLRQGARRGIPRSATEPLATYLLRLGQKIPELNSELAELIPILNMCLYGTEASSAERERELCLRLKAVTRKLKQAT